LAQGDSWHYPNSNSIGFAKMAWSKPLVALSAIALVALFAAVQRPTRGQQAEVLRGTGRRLGDSSSAKCGTTFKNTDFNGGDLKSRFGIFSPLACATACWNLPTCMSYTFVRWQTGCYLKSVTDPVHVVKKRVISGLRPCSAPPTPPPPKVYNYSFEPMRGVAYAPLPCKGPCMTSEDMLQEGYQPLWGAPPARDDLQVIKDLGANTVRLYHSIGLDGRGDHGLFLDRAATLGLDVMPGYHTYNAIYGGCPNFDCYATWKDYTLKAFKNGFQRNNTWHPAVSVLLLFNELDFFRGYGRTVHARAAISALDGVLAAEKEAGVEPGRVKLSIAWSNAPGESLDGKVNGFAIWAMQDVASCVANPSLAQYKPKTSQALLEEAYKTRWAHSINVQTPGILGYMKHHYHQFEPIPWFIGEYGANGMSSAAIQAELECMENATQDKNDPFMGMNFFQFQTAYYKGGSEMNFGLFRLGDREISKTGDICDKGMGCKTFPVHCLTLDKGSLPVLVEGRAEAVANAWGGSINSSLLC